MTARENNEYDIAVVGAGSAGFSAAITGAEQGAKVALIGHGTVGGSCVNTGCVPSKNLIRAAEALHHGVTAPRFAGIEGKLELRDWRAVLRQKDDLVSTLRQSKYVDLLADYDSVTYIEDRARLTSDGISLNGRTIRAAKVIVTTGASPSVPAIAGINTVPYLTSTTALELAELPRSLLVLGGGYIGCELGQMFARLGVRVTILDVVPILSGGEPEISRALARYFEHEGITVRENVMPRSVQRTDRGVRLELIFDGEVEAVEAERLLVATGRTPNTKGLGLEDVGIALLPHGGIEVDDRMRTTKSGVYAAGDVTSRDPFVYMAAYGAKIAATNALNGDKLRYDNTAVPSIVFTDPQVASVGFTAVRGRELGHDVKTSVLSLAHVPRALAARDARGLMKLVADSKTGHLLGAHILAPEGADSIQTAALAIKHRLTVTDLADTIFPYLTTVEGLRLAAQAFERDVAKLSCCAG